MNQAVQVGRSSVWRARLADGIGSGFVGWCLCASLLKRLAPEQSVMVRALESLAASAAFFVIGLYLAWIFSALAKSPTATRYLVLFVRVFSAGAVGAYAFEEFVEGCAAGLAVVAFGVFLTMVLRLLDDTGESVLMPSSSPSSRPAVGMSPVAGRSPVAVRGSVVTTGVRGSLRELFVMVVTGVVTGFIGGTLRFVYETQGGEPSCLFFLVVVLIGLTTRFLSAWLIQGKTSLRGWKRKLLAVGDGLVVVLLLAAAVSAELPPAVSWDGTVSRSPALAIPLGIALGFLWGVVFGSVKEMLVKTLQHVLDARSVANIGSDPTTNASTVPAPVGSGAEVSATAGRGVSIGGSQPSGADVGSPTPPDDTGSAGPQPRIAGARTSKGCSCCLAIVALGAGLLFALMASYGIWSPGKENADLDALPVGCPPDCREADLNRKHLAGAQLAGADLTGARLREAVLDNADLNGAVLRNASMFRVHLRDADLSGADFTGADMRRAILLGAHLENASLRDAYLEYATLQDLDLSTVDLEGAHLRNAVYSKATVWPPGFDVQAAGARLNE